MATLSGNKIKDTYQSLVKFSDNGNITVGAKQLTDGFGNNSPIFVSTTQVGIGVTPESGLNLHVYGDAKIGSNLTVIGNLVVEGSTTTVGTDTLTVKDPLIVLANNNTSTDAVDIGFYGKYTPSGTTLYSGLFREALTGKYRLFKDLQVEPTTTVNTSGTGYAQATLIAALEGNVTGNVTGNLTGNVTGNLTGNVTGGTISGTTGTFSGDVEVNGGDLSITSSTGLASVELGGASGGYIDIKAPESDDYDMRFIVSQGGNEITTASGDLKINTANTLALTIDSLQDATFAGGVSATTGTFSGDVNVNSNLIVTTGTPISGSANGSNVIAKIDSSAGTDSGGLEIHTGDDNGDEAALLHTNYNGDEAFRITSLGHIVSTGSASFVGQVTIPETPTADTHAASKGYVDAAVEGQDTLAEILAIGNTTGGTDIAVSANDDITFADNSKIIFGDSGDIEMFYNGSTFVIDDTVEALNGIDIDTNLVRFRGTDLYTELNNGQHTFWINGTQRFQINSTEVDVSHNLSVTNDLIVDTDTLFVDTSEDSVGIGLTNPSDYSADELVISVPDDSGMTLVSGTTDTAYIRFADGTAAADQANFISHDHDTNTLTVFSQAKVSIGILEAEVAYFTDTAFYVDKPTTIDDTLTVDGKIAIDTNIPKGKLDITGNSGLISSSLGQANLSSINLRVTNTVNRQGQIVWSSDIPSFTFGLGAIGMVMTTAGTGTNTGTADMIFSTKSGTSDAASTERMRIDSDGNSTFAGNVGIGGAASSTHTLDLNSSSNLALRFYDSTTFKAGMQAVDTGGQMISSSADGDFAIRSQSNMLFSTGGNTERMRIDSSGNVGIGTDDPNQLLEISKNGSPVMRLNSSKTTSGAAGDSIGRIEWRGSSTAGNGAGIKAAIDTSATSTTQRDFNILFKTSNNIGSGEPETRMQINADGKVGIGTNNPSRDLTIGDGSGNSALAIVAATNGLSQIGLGDSDDDNYGQIILRHSDGLLQIQNGGGGGISERGLNITSSENVGIGTTSPNVKLEISENQNPSLRFNNEDLSVVSGDTFGTIEWYTNDPSSSGTGIAATIRARAASSFTGSNRSTNITFSTASGTTAPTERMRITSGGFLKASNNGSYLSSTSSYHEFNNSTTEWTQVNTNTNSAGLGLLLRLNSSTASRMFLAGYSTNIAAYRFKIYADGDMENANNSYGALSDVKLKENIVDASPKLDDLMQVKIRNYNLIGEERKQLGVVAQELEEVFPALVYETPDTERQDINKTDEEGNIIYQTEEILISEAVKGQDAIEWEDKPTTNNTKVEIQTWLDDNEIEWQNADTKQELLDRIPEYQQEAVMPKDAVYETRETDEPVIENKEVDLGTTTKAVKYSVFVPMLIKGMQEQQQLINDLKSRIETLENN